MSTDFDKQAASLAATLALFAPNSPKPETLYSTSVTIYTSFKIIEGHRSQMFDLDDLKRAFHDPSTRKALKLLTNDSIVWERDWAGDSTIKGEFSVTKMVRFPIDKRNAMAELINPKGLVDIGKFKTLID